VVLPGMTRVEQSWRISDHYPLWVEFQIRVL
jgi:endonuclease/exonuclease/phosphatase (EEP) superfamily protein YafD